MNLIFLYGSVHINLGCENLYILHIVSKSVIDISKFLQKYQTKYQNSGKTVPLIYGMVGEISLVLLHIELSYCFENTFFYQMKTFCQY